MLLEFIQHWTIIGEQGSFDPVTVFSSPWIFPNIELVTWTFSFFLAQENQNCNNPHFSLSLSSSLSFSIPPTPISSLVLQEPSASYHCAPVWPGSTLSCHATLATCMDSPMTSAMAMDGPCSVRGGAWASHSSRGSSVPWPLLSNLSRGPTALNPDPRMGQCAKNKLIHTHI